MVPAWLDGKEECDHNTFIKEYAMQLKKICVAYFCLICIKEFYCAISEF